MVYAEINEEISQKNNNKITTLFYLDRSPFLIKTEELTLIQVRLKDSTGFRSFFNSTPCRTYEQPKIKSHINRATKLKA